MEPHKETTYRIGHSTAWVRPMPGSANGVLEIIYLGLLTNELFTRFRALMLQSALTNEVYIVRLERAVVALWDLPDMPDLAKPATGPGAAIVCRESELAFWNAHARRVAATYGVTRAVFPSQDLLAARRWAERHAAVRARSEAQSEESTTDFGSLK